MEAHWHSKTSIGDSLFFFTPILIRPQAERMSLAATVPSRSRACGRPDWLNLDRELPSRWKRIFFTVAQLLNNRNTSAPEVISRLPVGSSAVAGDSQQSHGQWPPLLLYRQLVGDVIHPVPEIHSGRDFRDALQLFGRNIQCHGHIVKG